MLKHTILMNILTTLKNTLMTFHLNSFNEQMSSMCDKQRVANSNGLPTPLCFQVRPKDGHVDHRVVPQCPPGRGGCLPAGRQALRRGRIRWPDVPEHRGVLRRTEQRVDRGKRVSSFQIYQENHNARSSLEKIAVLGGLQLRDAPRNADYQGCSGAAFLFLRLICMK